MKLTGLQLPGVEAQAKSLLGSQGPTTKGCIRRMARWMSMEVY